MVIGESPRERRYNSIVVVSEPGRSGAAALRQATNLAATSSCELTVVATAPQTTTSCRHCGGVSPHVYNQAVRDDIAEDLHRATMTAGLDTHHINVKLLIEGTDPPLADWIAQKQFDLVLLPARRTGLRFRSHPTAQMLRGLTSADIQVIPPTGR